MYNTKQLPIASVSGGKDSTALYCLMVETFGMDFLPIFADTGNEHPVTVNYVRNLHVMAGGPEVVIVKAIFTDKLRPSGKTQTNVPFLDMMIWKGRAPSPKAQFCTEWVKLWPMLLYLEQHHSFDEWIMYTGLRAGESEKRSKRLPFEWNTYFDCESINPMLYMTEQEIFDFLEFKGVSPNPLYAIGYGRVGCFPCIHAVKTQLRLLPDWAWEKLQYWESKIGRSWFPAGLVPGIHIPTIENVRNWCRTTRGGKQYDLFKTNDVADAPSCMSTWGICE